MRPETEQPKPSVGSVERMKPATENISYRVEIFCWVGGRWDYSVCQKLAPMKALAIVDTHSWINNFCFPSFRPL